MLDGRMGMQLSASLREGATPDSRAEVVTIVFQSTLPRRERRQTLLPARSDGVISIHAPAKGATKPLRKKAEEVEISIHAPRRSDVGRCNLERLTAISIHAPAKGATSSAGR